MGVWAVQWATPAPALVRLGGAALRGSARMSMSMPQRAGREPHACTHARIHAHQVNDSVKRRAWRSGFSRRAALSSTFGRPTWSVWAAATRRQVDDSGRAASQTHARPAPPMQLRGACAHTSGCPLLTSLTRAAAAQQARWAQLHRPSGLRLHANAADAALPSHATPCSSTFVCAPLPPPLKMGTLTPLGGPETLDVSMTSYACSCGRLLRHSSRASPK